jgi:hypothetical protein
MMRLVFVLLIAAAAWYGWKHYPELLHRLPSHEAVIANHTGKVLTRIRLTVDGKTFVKERLGDGETVTFPFRVENDSEFGLEWEFESALGQRTWKGGMVPKGPMVQRHLFTIDGDEQVVYEARSKLTGSGSPLQ